MNITTGAAEIAAAFPAEVDTQDTTALTLPNYNIPPGARIPMLVQTPDASFRMLGADWGLRAPHGPTSRLVFNARLETVRQKPMFRDLVGEFRCIVPVSGYYEWAPWRGDKQAHLIRPLNDGPFLWLASLWRREEGAETPNVTVLTRDAYPGTEALHHRSPVVLSAEDALRWASPDTKSEDALESAGRHAPGVELQFHPVSNDVGSVARNDASLLHEVDPDVGRTVDLFGE